MNLNSLTPTRKDPNNYQTNRAVDALRSFYGLSTQYARACSNARDVHGDGTGVLISGVYRDHFPAAVKDALRDLARQRTAAIDAALVAWKLAGRTHRTFLAAKDAAAKDGR